MGVKNVVSKGLNLGNACIQVASVWTSAQCSFKDVKECEVYVFHQ